MGLYKYIREVWKKPKSSLGSLWTERLIKWRREESTTRIEKPTRLDRARSLGYRAKPGIIMIRQRVLRGGHKRPTIRAGRRSRNFGQRMDLDKSYQRVAEERASAKFTNCTVLNSYWVAKDGKYYWYEIILVDRTHPAIVSDKTLSWITEKQHKSRAFRGLTSTGRKNRGLRHKGKGAEHLRPSKTANFKRKYLKKA